MAKILVIDDDVHLAEMTQMRLKASGHNVVVAHDALQATSLAHSEKPDLIILDLIMPVGGGVSTLRNLKMSSHTKTIPVIVISGTSDDELKEEVSSIGIDSFFEKPYDANELISKIEQILSN